MNEEQVRFAKFLLKRMDTILGFAKIGADTPRLEELAFILLKTVQHANGYREAFDDVEVP